LAEKARLVENLVFIDGCTRAGKMFLGNLVEGFENVEKFLYFSLPEQLSYINQLGLVSKETAKALILSHIDNFVYNRVIGRNLNFRFGDKSAISNSPNVKDYLRRLFEEDGDPAVKFIQESGRIFPFAMHEILPNISMFFDIYPNLKVIEIERNPIDLTYSWFQRGWGRRWGKDPKAFSVPIRGEGGPVPWFAFKWREDYEKTPEMDRIIRSMESLKEMREESLEKLADKRRKRIHFLTYEALSTKPEPELEKISDFLGRKIVPEMKAIMSRERFIPHPRGERDEKMKVIKEKASEESYSKLLKLNEEYEERWEKG